MERVIWSKHLLRNNRRPQRRQEQLLVEGLSGGRSLVIDNTDATAALRAPLIQAAHAHGAKVIGYYVPTEAGAALRRNRAREGRERVPDVAVFRGAETAVAALARGTVR